MYLYDYVIVTEILLNGWNDFVKILYVYFCEFVNGFKTQLDPVGGISAIKFGSCIPGRKISAESASLACREIYFSR